MSKKTHPFDLFRRARELGVPLTPRQQDRRAEMIREREQQRIDEKEDFELQTSIEHEEKRRAAPKQQVHLPRVRPAGETGSYILVPPETRQVDVCTGVTRKTVCLSPMRWLRHDVPRDDLDSYIDEHPGVVLELDADRFESDPLTAIREGMTRALGSPPQQPHFVERVQDLLRGRIDKRHLESPIIDPTLIERWLQSPTVLQDEPLRRELVRIAETTWPRPDHDENWTMPFHWPRLGPVPLSELAAEAEAEAEDQVA